MTSVEPGNVLLAGIVGSTAYGLAGPGSDVNRLDLLWLPDELYETRTPLGDEAIALRASFLSARRVKEAYLGYATQRFRKLVLRDQGSSASTPARLAKHARHLMRLVEQGYELYTTGYVRVRLADPERYRAFGERVAGDVREAAAFMAEAQERFAAARCVLAEEPDYAAAEDWLLRVRRAFWTEVGTAAAMEAEAGNEPEELAA